MEGDRQKPSCPSGMIEPGAWPDASESRFYQVAQACTTALRNLSNNSATPWQRELSDTFRNGGGNWSGSAADAANNTGQDLLRRTQAMMNALTLAANWNFDASCAISSAKNEIAGNVSNAMSGFNDLSEHDQEQRIADCYKQNLAVIAQKIGAVGSPGTYRPSIDQHQLQTNGLPPQLPQAGQPPPAQPAPPAPPKGKGGNTDETGTSPEKEPAQPSSNPAASSPGAPTTPGAPTSPGAPAAGRPGVTDNTGTTAPLQPVSPKANGVATPAGSNEKAAVTDVTGTNAIAPATAQTANAQAPGPAPGAAPMVAPPPGTRPSTSTPGGGTPAVNASSGGGSPSGGLGGLPSGSGTPQSGNPSGQPTGAQTPGAQPNNPLQQGLQQFGQGLQSGAGNASQPLASAQPATQQPTTPPPATPTGAASGTPGTSAAPVGAASAAGGGGSIGGPAAGTPAAPAAPLGPAPTPSPAAPVAQPGQGGPVGPAGPGVAAAGTNNQQAAAAAAPIPVSPARAERDAMAAAAKAGLLQRKSAGNTDADIEIARRISAALHAPPSIPAASYQFVWAVGVTSEGQILVANSYGIGYIPDGVKLPGQVTLVSADEAISPAERGRWVNFPFLAVQGWAQFHGKTLRAIIGTPEEVKPYKASMHAEELAPDDIPADGTMQGRSRLQVISPEAAARLDDWSDVTLYEALPPRPVQDAPPDAKQTMKLWVEAIKPLLRTTGTNGPIDHLIKLIAYADHMQNVELYKAYTAPHVAAQREAMSDWIYWQHISSICQDATNPVLGTVQA